MKEIKDLEAELLAELEMEENKVKKHIEKKYTDKSTKIANIGFKKKILLVRGKNKNKKSLVSMRKFLNSSINLSLIHI